MFRPHDGSCHLNPSGNYDKALYYDYVSPNIVQKALAKNSIKILFAISSRLFDYFKLILDDWGDVQTGMFSLDSNSVTLQKSLRSLAQPAYSKVPLYFKNHKSIHVSYQVSCLESLTGLLLASADCDTPKPGDIVTFAISVTALHCPTIGASTKRLNLTLYGVEKILLKYGSICHCKCTSKGDSSKQIRCNGHGQLRCGQCECQPGR